MHTQTRSTFATELPLLSDSGITSHVIGVLHRDPVVYKFLRKHYMDGRIERAVSAYDVLQPRRAEQMLEEHDIMVHKLIEKQVPVPKLRSSFVLEHLTFEDGTPIRVRVYDFVGPKKTSAQRVKPKNLAEERLDKKKAIGVVDTITGYITKLFAKADIMLTDTKLENFAFDSDGTIKLVDVDAEVRTFSKEEYNRVGHALYRVITSTLENNQGIENGQVLKKMKKKALRAISNHITSENAKAGVKKGFENLMERDYGI